MYEPAGQKLTRDFTLSIVAPLSQCLSPAGQVMRAAERFNSAVGHENRGFLSWQRGFVPTLCPRTQLGRDFSAWDQLAGELPVLYRDLTLRKRVEELPVLDASEQN